MFRRIARSCKSIAFHGWMAVDQDLVSRSDNGQIDNMQKRVHGRIIYYSRVHKSCSRFHCDTQKL